jgi:DNA helicase HerA-like ATPase
MYEEKNTLIGYLTETHGEYLIAELDSQGEDFEAERRIGMNTVKVGQVGSYLTVRQGDISALVMVDSFWRDSTQRGHPVFKIKVSPLGELNKEGEFTRGVRHFPTAGAELHLVSEWDLEKVFADEGGVGWKVGRLSAFDSVDIYLDASAFFGRHAAILGQSGSGKSWTVTSLIQAALRSMPRAHIILLDMHGEYCDKDVDGHVAKAPFQESKVRSMKARDLEFPYWLLSYGEMCELIVDKYDPNASIQLSFLRSIMMRLKREANKHLDLGHITVDSPVYYSFDEFVQLVVDANEETSDFGKTKSPLYGKFDQLLVRINSLLNDTRYDFLLKPKKRVSTETMVGLMEDFVGLGEPRASITVLDMSSVPFDVAPLVTAQVGRLAYEFNFWNPLCREFPIFLICEEAHEYIPREGLAKFDEARRSMERIAKNGRKYGVGICVVSQRPADVSETVLAQCSSYICLRISNPDDQAYVRSMVPDAAKGTFSALTSLSKGEAIALGEAVPMPVRFQVNLPDPPPNSIDMDYAGKWRHGGEEIDVAQIVGNWHKQIR